MLRNGKYDLHHILRIRILLSFIIFGTFCPRDILAQTKKKSSAKPAAAAPVENKNAGPSKGLTGEGKALEVRGQARSLQMMMLLKSKGEDIHFVKPRKDYHEEISATPY